VVTTRVDPGREYPRRKQPVFEADGDPSWNYDEPETVGPQPDLDGYVDSLVARSEILLLALRERIDTVRELVSSSEERLSRSRAAIDSGCARARHHRMTQRGRADDRSAEDRFKRQR